MPHMYTRNMFWKDLLNFGWVVLLHDFRILDILAGTALNINAVCGLLTSVACVYIYIYTYVFPSIFMRAYACILWLYIHVLMKTYDIHHIFHNIFNYIIYIYIMKQYIIYIHIYISIHTANIRQHLSILVLMKFQALSGGRSMPQRKKAHHMVGPRIV